MQFELNTRLLSLASRLAAQHPASHGAQEPQHRLALAQPKARGERERRTLCLECGGQGTWKDAGNGVGSKSLREMNGEQMATQALWPCSAKQQVWDQWHGTPLQTKRKAFSVSENCTSVVSFPTKCQGLNVSGAFLCITCTGSFPIVSVNTL